MVPLGWDAPRPPAGRGLRRGDHPPSQVTGLFTFFGSRGDSRPLSRGRLLRHTVGQYVTHGRWPEVCNLEGRAMPHVRTQRKGAALSSTQATLNEPSDLTRAPTSSGPVCMRRLSLGNSIGMRTHYVTATRRKRGAQDVLPTQARDSNTRSTAPNLLRYHALPSCLPKTSKHTDAGKLAPHTTSSQRSCHQFGSPSRNCTVTRKWRTTRPFISVAAECD